MNAFLGVVTLRQHMTYREEVKNRHRPWIGRTSNKAIVLEDNRLFVPIYNHGDSPTINMNIKFSLIDIPKNNEALNESLKDIDHQTLTPFKQNITLVPNEHYELGIPTKGKELFKFVLVIEYNTDHDSINGSYQILGEWDGKKANITENIAK